MIYRWNLVLTAAILGDRLESLGALLDRHTVSGPGAIDSHDDSALVRAARAGDRAAFGHLYDKYARMVHGVLLARVPYSEVDDLVQDVFLRALPRLRTLRDPHRFGAWLATIARNRATDYHRHTPAETGLDDELPNVSGEKEGRTVPGPEAASILAMIRSLPEAYRETLLLRLVEGMTGPEIAARTGLTPGSVRVNLHRGMQLLREKLSPNSNASETPAQSPSPDITSKPTGEVNR